MLTQLTMKWVSIVLLSLICCSSSRIVSKSDRHCYKQFAIEHVGSTDRMIYPIVFSGSSANHPYKDETDGAYTLLFNFNDKEFEKLKQGFYDFNKTIPIDTLAKNQTFYYGTFRIGIQDSCKPRKPFIFRDANAKSLLRALSVQAGQFRPEVRDEFRDRLDDMLKRWQVLSDREKH